MKDCRLIVLSHYDFTDKESGNHLVGSKVKVGKGSCTIDVSVRDNSLFKLELLKEYRCDLYINDELKIGITNIRG